jgi:lysophospholipase L1-like esterase
VGWPRLLGGSNADIIHLACSGAVINHITNTSQWNESPQLTALRRHAAVGPIDLVTVTIGGNDLGFKDVLKSCWSQPTCLGNLSAKMADADAVANRIRQLLPKLRSAAGGSEVVLVGYPRLFPTDHAAKANCWWLTSTERARMNQLTGYVDAAWRVAASRAGVRYISTLEALKGHELCTKDSWMVPIAASGTNWLTNQEQAHPNSRGQAAIRDVVSAGLSAP